MITWFYFLVFILSLVLALKCLIQNKNIDTLFVFFFSVIIINCMGRYLLAASDGLEMAIWANKFLYVGGVYAPLLAVLVLARLCDISLPRILTRFMTVFSTVILCLVFTIGKYDIYYKSVELIHENGYSYLKKTYGPAHILYPVMLILYAIGMIVFMCQAFKKRHYISFRIVTVTSVTCLSVIVIYIIERASGIRISLLSIGYLIGIYLLIRQFNYLNMYDMSSNIVTTVDKMKEYGYIVFDNDYQYVNANTMIKEIFPEVNQWEVDRPVPPSDSFLYQEVIMYLAGYDGKAKQDKKIKVGETFLELTIREIEYGKKGKIGYLLEFSDRTVEQKYYNAIEEYNGNL